ncbi:phage tail tape measure protein [Paenibacillus wenxiniae]|uniref:Phage tail tape measure protein n=1 Tax=Paenibacillus wenxiniae TaxID=1636843 RepID=A0ABW4RLV4_9BACL
MGVIGNLMFAVGFKANTGPLGDVENKISGLKIGVVGLGVALGGIAAASVNAASQFEQAMAQVQMTTGQTNDQMEQTREIAKGLYSQNFGADWADLGTSISTVAQVTGQTGAELENTTKNALLLQHAFGYEVAESVKTTDTMMKQFGITSEQSMNLLAQGAQKGLDKSGELMDTANEYANQFKSLGFSADEMFDTLAAGSANGAFNLDKVGDAVKEFNIRAKDGSKSTNTAFQMLGLDTEKMMHTFAAGGPEAKKSFQQVLQMIGDIEDPVQRNTVGVALMGSQFEDLEASTIKAMGHAKSQFDQTKDTMEQLNKIKFNSPGEAMAMFGRQIETGILIPIGEKLLPYLNKFGQWVADHKPQIEAFGQAIGDKVAAGIDGVTAAVQAVLPTLKAVWQDVSGVATAMYQWEGFLPVVAGLVTAFYTYRAAMASVVVWQKLQAIWTARAIIWQTALNVVMSLNPIGVVIAAIVGLVAAFVIAYKRSETFRDIVNKAWASIKVAFSATMNFFTVTVPQVFNNIVVWIINAFNKVKSFFTVTIPAIFNTVINFIITWGPLFLIALTGPIGIAVALVVMYWDQIYAFTVSIFSAAAAWIAGIWNSITGVISGAVMGAWNFIVNAWNAVKSFHLSIFTAIYIFLNNVWTNIVTAVTTKVTSISTTITNIWNNITTFLQGINLLEIGSNIIDGLINGIKAKATAVVDSVKEIGNSITSAVTNVLDIHSPSRVFKWIGEMAGAGLQIGIQGTQQTVGGAAADLATTTVDHMQPAYNGANYTPENAPARGRSGSSGTMIFNFNINVDGDSGSAEEIGQSIAAEVRHEVQAILEQTFRRMGLPMPEVNM